MGDYRAKLEFTAPYKGDADKHLQDYVTKCWLSFCDNESDGAAPHVTLLQSSGFGKSRSLYELARRSKDSAHMKVIYMCARANRHSRGYPLSTPSLHHYWFPRDDLLQLVTRLCSIFDYAVTHWDQVGGQWMRVFTEYVDDAAVARQLSAFQRGHVGSSDAKLHTLESSHRVVVFAVDVARDLNTGYPTTDRALLERALTLACGRIQAQYGKYAGILGLLVDNDPIIIRPSDPFPPFVLTQNVDVMLDGAIQAAQSKGTTKAHFYQQLVCAPLAESRAGLMKMGRPLWWSLESEGFAGVVKLAASKLMVGLGSGAIRSETMDGLPALTARLGTLELSHSPDADHFVGNAMATLLDASNGRSARKLCGAYLPEPIVAFGATHTWYDPWSTNVHYKLAKFLLPRLRQLEEVKFLDAHARGRLVASIVMLLAMDAVGVVVSGDDDTRLYSGAFYSVSSLLDVLSGSTTEIEEASTGNVVQDGATETIKRWCGKWSDWKVGFGHVLPLSQPPSGDVLWILLSRRAAGVLSSTQGDGADIVIPIFLEQAATNDGGEPVRRVSCIRLRVTNFAGGDPSFPKTITKPLDDPHAIDVYMNLRGPKSPRRFFLQTPSALVLCLEGLQVLTATGKEKNANVAVVPPGVVKELKKLAKPDLEDIPGMEIVRQVATANGDKARPLIDAILGGKWPAEDIQTVIGSKHCRGEDSARSSDDPPSKLSRRD